MPPTPNTALHKCLFLTVLPHLTAMGCAGVGRTVGRSEVMYIHRGEGHVQLIAAVNGAGAIGQSTVWVLYGHHLTQMPSAKSEG